jgi:hypothetical protein
MFISKILFLLPLINIFEYTNCFIAIPFNTIWVKNDSISPQNDYRAKMLQNELYLNISVGTPKQNIKAILKMDLNGFVIYNGSFNRSSSESYEIIDTERRLTCFPQISFATSKDYFYIPSFDSYKDFNKYVSNPNNYSNDIQTRKSEFMWVTKLKDSITQFNDMFENYAIIGLKIYYSRYFIAPEFVTKSGNFTGIRDLKEHNFYLKFNDNKINGFFNSNNSGYFIAGEEIVSDEKEKSNIKYTRAVKRINDINWDLAFDDISSKSKINKENIYKPEYKHAEFHVNFPYILGPRDYDDFLSKIFFHELVLKEICNYIYNINGEEYAGYKCNSTSKIFLEKLDKEFPDLIFEHKELEEKFIFTKNDLFTYNMYNESDEYLYFVVLFPLIKSKYHVMSWILGIPFIKKYTLSFNYDTKMIGYYKKESFSDIYEKNKYIYLYVIVSVVAVVIAFILGFYTHKKFCKNGRKIKANELDDNYEYIEENKENNKDGDTNNENNDENKESKLIIN